MSNLRNCADGSSLDILQQVYLGFIYFNPNRMNLKLLALFLLNIATGRCLARDPLPTPVADPARLMPLHGTVSTVPAARWEQSVLAGNGNMGVALAGSPQHDVLIGDHCKLWLPAGAPCKEKYGAAWMNLLRFILP
jgi:hypothetical protein